MSVPEVMWRCRTCGKWSHAQRRPQRHQRFAGDGDFLTDEQEKYVAQRAWTCEHDTGAWVSSVWFWCGPFDRFEAHAADDTPPKPLDPAKFPPAKGEKEGAAMLPAGADDDAEIPF